MPKEEGNYLLVVKLETDSGNTEYVGNLNVQERDDNPYPPSVSLHPHSDETDINELESYQADWAEYTLETADMSFFRSELEPFNYHAGEQMKISFDHQHFKIEDLLVYTHHNDEKNKFTSERQFL